MAKKKIHVYNDPVLRRKARPVNQISGTIRKLVEDMFETMNAGGGVGLAAPQVGVSKRVIIVDTKEVGEKLACINPKIVSMSKNDLCPYNEGCLSLPDMEAEVIRPRRVTLEYTTLDGEPSRVEAEGLLARVIQHECDHLEGILFVDRVDSPRKRQALAEEMGALEAAVHV